MGNLFSYAENVEEEIKVINEIEKVEKFAEQCKDEIVKLSEEITERVIIDVVEEIAVSEIEHKFSSTLTPIQENPENSDPTHYSNLKYQLAQMPLQSNKLQQYESSDLTKFYNLYDDTAAQQWKERRHAFYH